MRIGKPRIYFNRAKRMWCVDRNQAGPDAWIRAMSHAHKLNSSEVQS